MLDEKLFLLLAQGHLVSLWWFTMVCFSAAGHMCAFPKSGPVTWRGMCAGSHSTSNLLIYFCISWYAGFLMAKCWVKWPLAGTSALFCMLSVEALKVKPANWGSQALWWVVWHLPWWWDRAPPATFSASPLEAVCQVNLRNWVPCHSKKKKKKAISGQFKKNALQGRLTRRRNHLTVLHQLWAGLSLL